MKKTIGVCSQCGGDVEAHTGPWYSVNPPPVPACIHCGTKVAQRDVHTTSIKSVKLSNIDKLLEVFKKAK